MMGFCNYFRRFIKKFGEFEYHIRKAFTKGANNENQLKGKTAFDLLKQELMSGVKLASFDVKLDTYIQTDASNCYIGAILYQTDRNGNQMLINYSPRKLKETEERYSTTEKELLAIHNAIKNFAPYLIGMDFTIRTDHKPLIGMLTRGESRLSGRWNRRLMAIEEFKFKIEYVPGTENKAADYLSRRVNAIRIELPELSILQRNDRELADMKKDSSFVEEEEIMTKIMKDGNQVIVLPVILRHQALKEAHTEGHLGAKKTLKRLQMNFYWEKMGRDVDEFVSSCDICQRFSSNRAVVAESQHLEAKATWMHLAIDFMGPFELGENKIYVLVIIDLFSKFTLGRIMTEPTSKNIVDYLREIFSIFGSPRYILSDNAANFKSEEMARFYAKWGISRKNSTAYNPQGNGIVERVIQTIKRGFVRLLYTIPNPQEALNNIVSAYNNSWHRTIKEVPARVMFNRSIKLPLRRMLDNDTSMTDVEEEPIDENKIRNNIESANIYQDEYLKLKGKIRESMKYENRDKVMLKKEVRENNLMPYYYGPFTIQEKIGPNVYKLVENGRLVSVRRLKKFKFQKDLIDVDWTGIVDLEEGEDIDEDQDALVEKTKRELMVMVDKFYETESLDQAISDLREFGVAGYNILKKLIRHKPKEKVMEKIRRLKMEDCLFKGGRIVELNKE